MNNTYFYMRISTKEASDKQSFQRQYKALEKYADENDLKFDNRTIFKDDVSGSTFNRDDWKALEGYLKSGDKIVFKEISRFTRQADEGFEKYMELMNNGIELVFLDNPTVSTDYIKQLCDIADKQQKIAKKALNNTIELLLFVELDRVEKEREIIVKRIKDGLKASGKKSGRKFGNLDKMTVELRLDILEYLKNRDITKADLVRKHKISRNTMKKYIDIIKSEEESQ